MKYLPGALGALLVVAGCSVVALWLGLVVAGGFLLALDRRIN